MYLNDLNIFFIGEDSLLYINNFVWVYNVKIKKLLCIFLVLVGVEVIGFCVVENIKNFCYVLSNYQYLGEDISDKNIIVVDKEELVNVMKESIGI